MPPSEPPTTTSSIPKQPELSEPSAINSTLIDKKLTSETTDKSCSALMPGDGLYAINPNMTLDTSRTSAVTEIGKAQIQLGGISCTAINATTKMTVIVTAVKLTRDSAKAKSDELAASGFTTYIPSPSSLGYFTMEGLSGIGQFVKGQYWVSVASDDFKTATNPSAYSFLASKNL